MNEAETRAEYIDPQLKENGWGEIEGSKVLREFRFTDGKIQAGGKRAKPEIADYILVYKNQKLAVIEAKPEDDPVAKGVAQAKDYAHKLRIEHTYATNGKEIYAISMKTGNEELISRFPTPEELWNKVYSDHNIWKEKFSAVPYETIGGSKPLRYYQEIAVNKALDAVAEGKQRMLLTLATGTGKTFIAFQIAWKLFQTRWNLQRNGSRQPRILFLADRNTLAGQAFKDFLPFGEDAVVRIKPESIRAKGFVPTSQSIFVTIFQTFMSGPDNTSYFGEYPRDFFDFIIIDECHRGGANDESTWREILEYFSPAVQLGLTATPKRKDNVDTYRYFGEPLYTYSLKEGINDGFLTPFKVKRIRTTLDEYIYTSDDQIIEGEIEEGRIYQESDFNRIIEIKEREAKRVQIMLSEINQKEKTIVFCANQDHALAVRDLINQHKESSNPFYCVRVTANDGARGDQYLSDFQDNEKTIPTILTTSQKLSTGVDARNVRNIVLMRPINSMIEFKQIIGRGTRLFDGKEYFTIIDFVDAYKHFADPEWDGEPLDVITEEKVRDLHTPFEIRETSEDTEGIKTLARTPKIIVKLGNGKERQIQHMISTSFWSVEGKPLSAGEFLQKLINDLPKYFTNEKELRTLWSVPSKRKTLLESLQKTGYGSEELEAVQEMLDAKDYDLFDVLNYVAFSKDMLSRKYRASQVKEQILSDTPPEQHNFLEFVLSNYIEQGESELNEDKLPTLLNLKYHSIADAEKELGGVLNVRSMFFNLQRHLYSI